MLNKFKAIIFRFLSLNNYLRILQSSYFILYYTGILKFNGIYKYHYFVKNLINEGDVIIDIGANLGYYSMLFSKWAGKSGRVYSVEPVPVYNKVFKELANNRCNIKLYPYALGKEEKTIEMVSSPGKGYLHTGLLHVYDPQRDGNIENQEFRFKAEMKKPSKLFGSLEKINYIKCDIEGFEYAVLSEMKEIIRRHKPKVQVEVTGKNKEKLSNLFFDMGCDLFKLKNDQLVPERHNTVKFTGG